MAGNHVLLETISLTQAASSITFDNIPQTGYTDLKVVVSARTNNAATSDTVLLNLNGLTTNQSSRRLQGDGGSVTSNAYSLTQFVVNGNTATSNTFGSAEIYIPNYNSTTTYKSISIDSIREGNETNTNTQMWAGLWSSNSAVTSIQIAGQGSSFLINSTFSLYGVAATGTTPAVAPKATGGNIVANDGTYWYHAFLTSGNFVPQTPLTCNILQVAGGGGGSSDSNGAAGGGGAGGLLGFTNQALASLTNYAVVIGAGGAGYPISNSQGLASNGSNSQFASLTASVGGGGGSARQNALSGGSGGGGGDGTNGTQWTPGSGTSGQGNAGGAGTLNQVAAGGGGGAVSAGSASSAPHVGGAGGAGSSAYSAYGLATNTGHNVSGTVYYAGGGGGATYESTGTLGPGGVGGGGSGAKRAATAATAGIAGTGGGGGGGSSSAGDNRLGQNGGSGIVIIRYAMV